MSKKVKRYCKFSHDQNSYHNSIGERDLVVSRDGVTWETLDVFNTVPKDRMVVKKQIEFEKTFDVEPNIDDRVLFHIEKLRTENKRNYIVNNFHDYKLVDAIRCILSEISESSEELHDVFLGARKIGAHSVSGSAVYSKRGNVIFKIPNDIGSDEMRHEFLVGLVLSKLRKTCVNFSVVYDVFSEGIPIISQSGQVVQACNSGEEKTTIAVYEYVNESLSMSDLQTGEEFLSCFIQSILALYHAYLEFDFTHYDAHDENILTYKFSDDEFYIKYNHLGEDVYVKSFGRISMFIDYGRSHIKYQNKHYGIIDKRGSHQCKGTYSDLSNPGSDQLKLIFMLIRKFKMKEKSIHKNLCFRLAEYFFGRFDEEDFDYIHMNLWDCRYYTRPETMVYMKWRPEDFISHCLTVGREYGLITQSRPDKILGENVNSNLRYNDVEEYKFSEDCEDYNLSIPKEYFRTFHKSTAVAKLERNFDKLARFISRVINAREEDSDSYEELKLRAYKDKEYVRKSLEVIEEELYGKNPTRTRIREAEEDPRTKDLAAIFPKINNIVGSFLKL